MSRDLPRADAPRNPEDTPPDTPQAVGHDVDVVLEEHDRGVVDRVAASADAESLGDRVDRALSEIAPELASVTRKIAEDRRHPLDLTRALHDPARRERSLELLAELGEGRLLRGQQHVTDYTRERPGRGPLFEPVPSEVNHVADGRTRMEEYISATKADDPVRATERNPDDGQRALLDRYARRLDDDVLPAVIAEVDALVESIPDAQMSMRVKTADGILDKVERMTSGSESRPPRPGYAVGDVIDAVGARITVEDTDSLAN